MMLAVDTNVLIRILISDNEQREQIELARKFAKKAKLLFVSQVVQVELVWVLEVAYKLNKADIVRILQHLQANEAFQLQHDAEFSEALQLFQANNVDFSDCIILMESKKINSAVITFDKKFSRLPGVTFLH